MKKGLLAGMSVVLLMFCSMSFAANEATFDFGTGVLNIPKVQVGSDYYDATLQQQGQSLVFVLTGAVSATSTSSDNVATYHAGTVHIPVVVVGGNDYTVDMTQGEGLNFVVTGVVRQAEVTIPSSTPWLGQWIQVNYLSVDDNGVWGQDDNSGIGFVADITSNSWTETDNNGAGEYVTFTYTVDANNLVVKDGRYHGINFRESGRLEFSGNYMIEYYDTEPGDDILAFKWMRR